MTPQTEHLLTLRAELTASLRQDPYAIHLYHQRSTLYAELAYADLAAADAYKVLLLADEITDDAGECHEQALESVLRHLQELDVTAETISDPCEWVSCNFTQRATLLLSKCLSECGCLRSAYEYALRAVKGNYDGASDLIESILGKIRAHYNALGRRFDEANVIVEELPENGLVRREVYPWSNSETDRHSAEALEALNTQMAEVAPYLEVKVTRLPVLGATFEACEQTVEQLGVFARKDLASGEEILCERSLLTANTCLHDPLCDACNTALPELNGTNPADEDNTPVACPECDDVVFCSSRCLEDAQASYHPAICGADIDTLLKDGPAAEASTALYTLLLHRALAMSLTQNIHPLDLREIKYIWGDFEPPGSATRTLPFSFAANIQTPLHFLTQTLFHLHGTDIFSPVPLGAKEEQAQCLIDIAEPWVHNILLAKFRGTASARMSPRLVTRGGGAITVRAGVPDTAVVHPLWCLANHSCDPNVRWEWSREDGDVRFWVRDERVAWKGVSPISDEETGVKPCRAGGIRKGEEILGHYVDIDLPVKERREWGAGALGGFCRCDRCMWEAGERGRNPSTDGV